MSKRIQDKQFPFTYDGWDEAGGDYGDVQFYKVEFTEDFGPVVTGKKFDCVVVYQKDSKMVCITNGPANKEGFRPQTGELVIPLKMIAAVDEEEEEEEYPERDHANECLLYKVFPAKGDKALHHGALCVVDGGFGLSDGNTRVTYYNGSTCVVKKADLVPFNIVDEYNRIQDALFEYFGYVQDWRVIPTDNQTGRYWMICGPEDDNSTKVAYSDKPFTKELIEKGEELYSGTIYTQRHLPKWVYRGAEHTMVAVDTHCDGNQVLMIFDNDKECTDQATKDLYNETW
jgi:hypothetical protein